MSCFTWAAGPPVLPWGFSIGTSLWRRLYDSITKQDGWAFLIGNRDFNVANDVSFPLWGDSSAPVGQCRDERWRCATRTTVQSWASSTDPKLSLLWRATPGLSLHASVGTSFRAPTPFQTQGIQTRFVNITDHDGSTTFGGDRTVGNRNLGPETSTAWNLGLNWMIDDRWSLDLSYWRFSFKDVLTKTNAQAIVTANPLDPRVQRTSAGTIAIVRTSFVNANAIDTGGIDLALNGRFETGAGVWSVGLDASQVLAYDLEDETGRSIDGAGKLNRGNFGDPMPELRANLGLGWQRGGHAARLYLRHVSSYKDDVRNDGIEDFTTLDAQYSFRFGERLIEGMDTTVAVGVINATDENPPLVRIAGNYDPKTGDPRGRRVYLRVSLGL